MPKSSSEGSYKTKSISPKSRSNSIDSLKSKHRRSNDEKVTSSSSIYRKPTRSISNTGRRSNSRSVSKHNQRLKSLSNKPDTRSNSRSISIESKKKSRSRSILAKDNSYPDNSRVTSNQFERYSKSMSPKNGRKSSRNVVKKNNERHLSRSKSFKNDWKRRSRSKSYKYERRRRSRSNSVKRERRRRTRSNSYKRDYRKRTRSNSYKRRSRRNYSRSRSPYHRYNRSKKDNLEPCSCIGVFGLSQMTTEDTLWNYFERFGKIKSLKLIKNSFAFIDYKYIDSAIDAMKNKNDINIDGVMVRLDYSNKKQAEQSRYNSRVDSRSRGNRYLDKRQTISRSPRRSRS